MEMPVGRSGLRPLIDALPSAERSERDQIDRHQNPGAERGDAAPEEASALDDRKFAGADDAAVMASAPDRPLWP